VELTFELLLKIYYLIFLYTLALLISSSYEYILNMLVNQNQISKCLFLVWFQVVQLIITTLVMTLRLRLDPGVPLLSTTEVTTAPCLDPCMLAGECGRKD